jgi:hypothetical protein
MGKAVLLLLFAAFYVLPLVGVLACLPLVIEALGAGPSVWMLLAQFGALAISCCAFVLSWRAGRLSWAFGSMLTWGAWSWTAGRGYGWLPSYEFGGSSFLLALRLGPLRLDAGEVLNEIGVNVPVVAVIICLVFFLERRRLNRSMQRAAL